MFSNTKGETMAYVPDMNISWQEQYKKLFKSIKHKFGIQASTLRKTPITYNPFNNVNSVNAKKFIGTNILKSDNLEQFWKLLVINKRLSVMNFMIGNILGRKARIICVESLQNNSLTMMLFPNNDNDDMDWDEIYQTKFIPFVKKALTNNNNGDNDDNVDYDELPFKIYKINSDNVDNVKKFVTECDISNFDTIVSKYELDEEVEDGGELENCYEENDDSDECYFFVENKACFVAIYKNKKPFFWTPSGLDGDLDEINWENEFLAMKKDICNFFSLANNGNLAMTKMDDSDGIIGEGVDLEEMFTNAYDDDDLVYLKINVTGDPLIKFIISCPTVSPNNDTISLSLGLDLSKQDKEVFDEFDNGLRRLMFRFGKSQWKNKFELIDNCHKKGNLIPTPKKFLTLCKMCQRRKISPIQLLLEPKVCMSFFLYV